MTAAAAQRTERDPDVLAGTPGVYLDFEIPAGSEEAAERLENRQKHIELVALRQASADAPATATVFVPDTAADHFLKKVEQYRDENTRTGKPKTKPWLPAFRASHLRQCDRFTPTIRLCFQKQPSQSGGKSGFGKAMRIASMLPFNILKSWRSPRNWCSRIVRCG
jgi:hypothetical protein